MSFAKQGACSGRLTSTGQPVKTKMCHFFTEQANWRCKHGDKCIFAHYADEIGTARLGNSSMVATSIAPDAAWGSTTSIAPAASWDSWGSTAAWGHRAAAWDSSAAWGWQHASGWPNTSSSHDESAAAYVPPAETIWQDVLGRASPN